MIDKAVQVSGRMVSDFGAESILDETSEVLIPQAKVTKRSKSFCYTQSKLIEIDRKVRRSNSAVKMVTMSDDESSTLKELAQVNNLTSKIEVAIGKKPRDFKLLQEISDFLFSKKSSTRLLLVDHLK